MFISRTCSILPACRRQRTWPVTAAYLVTTKSNNFLQNNNSEICITKRNLSTTGLRCQQQEKSSAVSTTSREAKPGELTLGQKVKETTKDVSYLGVIIGGVGVTALMFYAIFRELFSSQSPNSVYSEALKRCCTDPRIVQIAGEPIKGYGEETRRGRRRHVAHAEYIKDGVNHMRMKFYIQGSMKKGTVHLEVKENDKGRYEYRYLFVDFEGPIRNTVILEDNRWQQVA